MSAVDEIRQNLLSQKGVNPKPEDFDVFWETSLKEAEKINTNVIIEPARFLSPVADCYDLYFTGTYNSRIHAKLLLPKERKQKCPALLHFHGLSGASEDWSFYLKYAAGGIVVAAMDCRGQNGLSNDNCPVSLNTYKGFLCRGITDEPSRMYYRNVYLDTVLLAKTVMGLDCVDENNVSVYGISQGGGLSLICASLVPNIKKAAVGFPFLCDFKKTHSMGLGGVAHEDIGVYFSYYDPLHENEDGLFNKLGYIDVQNFAERINAEVKWFVGMKDTACPPCSQMSAYNKIKSRKELLIYPEYGHDTMTGSNDIVYSFLIS
ncbi:MAG: acetylxylan esterase [Clostridia bacterium]|nr:acetylxylan esterase [Clostridia bacterium]